MRIAIYTSNTKGCYNMYNIACLLEQFRDYTFLFVEVTKNRKKSFEQILRQRYYDFREPKGSFNKDRKLLDKTIKSLTPKINFKQFDHVYVDKVNDHASQSALENFQPHIVLQAGAGILKENIFRIAKIGTLNVHHGFAPEIRGIQSTFWCLYYGLTDYIGVTCHFIDKNLDTGNIVKQFNYSYREGDTYLSIQENLCIEGSKLLNDSIEALSNKGTLNYEKSEVKSYYFSSVKNEDYLLLKRNNFKSLANSENLKFKMKTKAMLIV